MNETIFKVDGNLLTVTRIFNANLELVWRTWTEAELLDLWWAPKPWKSKTKSMDFKEGGHRLYAMVGPEGEEHWGRTNYISISKFERFTGEDVFCDADGVVNQNLPVANFNNEFVSFGDKTEVTIATEYASEGHLNQVLKMGMKEGLSSAFENLDQYIELQFKLRQQNKKDKEPRVSTYLNFAGNTEEAFLFYRAVFKTEFIGKGIERFGDIPSDAGHPPIADTVKNMVLHVELPIVSGHILMGTDAPKEMGFKLTQGNNMHICIEPETRKEADRLFNELSKEGNVIMPMADMFFGSYFGECRDKYGINWMINFQN